MLIYITINGPLYPESIGGSEIFAHSLATELKKKGHDVIMIGNLGDDTEFDFPYRVVSLGSFQNIRSRIVNLLRVKDALDREGLTRKEGSVLSVMAHSSLLGERVKRLTGSHMHVLRFGGLDLDILTNPLLNIPYYLYSRWGLSIIGQRSNFVVMSKDMWLKALKLGLPERKLSIIPNLIERRFFDINPRNSILEGYNVVYVGRLEKIKGIDLLLEALKLVQSKEPRVRLVIYGRGSLERLVLKHGFVDFRGPLPYEKIHEAYQEASIFVLPSRYEGLPNSLLQAMASGLPVIATRVGGVPELIKDKYNGLLIRPDIRELSETILYLLEKRSEALEMGSNARRSVSHLTPDRIAFNYERILGKLVNSITLL